MRLSEIRLVGILLSLAASLQAAPALAQRPSLLDSFRLGNRGGVLCQVQSRNTDAAIKGMFDRAWTITCRDAARPVGKLYALRGADAQTRLSEIRKADTACSASATNVTVEGLGPVSTIDCRLNGATVGYRVYSLKKGQILLSSRKGKYTLMPTVIGPFLETANGRSSRTGAGATLGTGRKTITRWSV